MFFNDGPCPLSNTCDFESADLCGYLNDPNSDYDWKRIQGFENNLNTEDDIDHSYGTQSGHYMITKSEQPHTKNKLSRLLSPTIPATTICLSFWYKVYGDIQFNIRTYRFNTYDARVYFSALGDRGSEWSYGQTTIQNTVISQIVFESVDQGPNLRDGRILLDDIEIKYKPCSALASCDFEDKTTCGYNLVSSSDFNWLLLDGHYGLNQNEWSVPTFDHTTNQAQGSFIYLDTNNKQQNKKALIESEVISKDMGYMCLQFYLKTNINNKATLNLNRKNKLNGQLVALYSTSEAISDDVWMFKEVQLPDKSSSTIDYPYSVVFEGVVGLNTANLKGQLAIDDIKLYNGTCAPITTQTSKPTTTTIRTTSTTTTTTTTQTMTTTRTTTTISTTTFTTPTTSSTQTTPITSSSSTVATASSTLSTPRTTPSTIRTSPTTKRTTLTSTNKPTSSTTKKINVCTPDYCLNGATCSVSNNILKCFCIPGFTGPKCESSFTVTKKNSTSNGKHNVLI